METALTKPQVDDGNCLDIFLDNVSKYNCDESQKPYDMMEAGFRISKTP